jgi:hypothetical protein
MMDPRTQVDYYRARVRGFIDRVLKQVLPRSRYKDPQWIRVNGKWIHVDDYEELVGRPEVD